MITLPLSKCSGIDTRTSWDNDDFSLVTGNNLQVIPGGSLTCRPALVKDAYLSALSVGLYSRGNFLRAIVPSGHSTQSLAPTGVIYDGIGRGGSYDYASKLDRILAFDTFGTSQVHGPHGVVAIKRSDTGVTEHHWIKEPPSDVSTFTSTWIDLPFQPGAALYKIARKIVVPDPSNGYIRYCSSLNGPTDYVTTGDAGFEAALEFVSGAREVISLGSHRGALAVFYADAVQLWNMDPIPANISLAQTLNGPGTAFPGSVANIYGDAIFFGRGGFSNLENAKITAEATYGDIGDAIKTLTDSITTADTLHAVWSQKRAQYLCAVGTTIYCYANYPKADEKSWMRWTFPVTIDAMTENQGIVYIRSGNELFHLDDTIARDSGQSSDIAWEGQTRYFSFIKQGKQSDLKSLRDIVVQCTARTTWTPVCDGRTLTRAAVTIPGSTGPKNTSFTGSGRRVAVNFVGSGAVRIDGLVLSAEACAV